MLGHGTNGEDYKVLCRGMRQQTKTMWMIARNKTPAKIYPGSGNNVGLVESDDTVFYLQHSKLCSIRNVSISQSEVRKKFMLVKAENKQTIGILGREIIIYSFLVLYNKV